MPDQLTELSATLIGPPGPPGQSRPGRPGPPGAQGPSGIPAVLNSFSGKMFCLCNICVQ